MRRKFTISLNFRNLSLQDIIKTPTNESDTSQLIINGNTVTDKLKVANEFNKYFNNVGQNLSQNLNRNSIKDYLQNNISSKFSFKKATTKKLKIQLKNYNLKIAQVMMIYLVICLNIHYQSCLSH